MSWEKVSITALMSQDVPALRDIILIDGHWLIALLTLEMPGYQVGPRRRNAMIYYINLMANFIWK